MKNIRKLTLALAICLVLGGVAYSTSAKACAAGERIDPVVVTTPGGITYADNICIPDHTSK
jgi:hypothetical protein